MIPGSGRQRIGFRRMSMQEALRARPAQESQPAAFRQFTASELYCTKCKQAMPVRERLLLALPSGDLFDYLCTGCGNSLGTKNATE